MGRGDVEILRKLTVGDDIFHIFGQALAHIVINFIVGFAVSVIGRRNQQSEDDQKHGKHLDNAFCEFAHVGNQCLVLCFL